MYILFCMMQYFEVFIADSSFKGSGALTYQYYGTKTVVRGQIVIVPIKQKHVYGVVTREVKKPSFAARDLELAPTDTLLPSQLIDLAAWITTYYLSGIGVTMQQFLPQKIYPADKIAPSEHEVDRDLPALPPLTAEQNNVLRRIDHPDTYILHGETGSGKTRVYIELAARTLRAGRSSIVLTPEIGLTPQLVNNFLTVFGAEQVMLTHSQLTVKERSILWLRMLTSLKPLIVIGPRSALFSPLRDVGLIILDEAHESSYKQDQAPHYHAGKVAARLASLHKATTILGSATPAIIDYFLAEAMHKPILRMRDNARSAPDLQTATHIVNLTDRKQFSRQPHISDTLITSIEQSLNRKEQSLVFLNRRGTARVVLCQQCGWQSVCPHCDLPLTYHGDLHNVRCHTCGYDSSAPTDCPECSSTDIILKSVGTKAIVDELTSIFPYARIQRFDTDNNKDERLEAHYHNVREGNVDIIVGTQLIAKGLDLPKLSTVGVVVADTSLYLPDYSSSERSYQLLRQVIGRVGRGHRSGSVVIQTYDPSNPVIQAAAQNGGTDDTGWDKYYHNELKERKAFTFPPYCYTLKIWCRRATSKSAMQTAQKATDLLRNSGLRIMVDGPMPAFHEKAGGKFQWQAIIKAKDRGQLIQAIKILPANWSFDIDPNNLL